MTNLFMLHKLFFLNLPNPGCSYFELCIRPLEILGIYFRPKFPANGKLQLFFAKLNIHPEY